MNEKTSANYSKVSQLILRVKRGLIVIMAVLLVGGLSFLGLALSSRLVHAAPPQQREVWQFTLPVTNTAHQTSIYTVTNLTTQTISIRHEFYAGGFPGGRFVAVLTDTQFLLEKKIYALSRIPNFPVDFVGAVVVTSNQPITGSAITRAKISPTPVSPSATPVPAPGGNQPLLPPLPSLRPERVEINWTLVTYIIVGIFALSGFFKGWWKEAITTFFLGILIFFLAVPDAAAWFIQKINEVMIFVWDLLANLKITLPINLIQLNPSSGQTWLVILLLFMGLAIFISRAGLSGVPQGGKKYILYVVTPMGQVLGAILGGLNGFLIVNLVKHYLEGSGLPGSSRLPTEIVMTSGNVITTTASGSDILITGLPGFALFSFLLPWLVIAFVVLMVFLWWRRLGILAYFQHSYEIKKEKDKDKEKTTITDLSESGYLLVWDGFFWRVIKLK